MHVQSREGPPFKHDSAHPINVLKADAACFKTFCILDGNGYSAQCHLDLWSTKACINGISKSNNEI